MFGLSVEPDVRHLDEFGCQGLLGSDGLFDVILLLK
jgi:hypothetical protein